MSDTERAALVAEAHTAPGWGRMKRELMEWMNEYAEIHGPTVQLRRPSHRATLAYFLACKITGEPIETGKPDRLNTNMGSEYGGMTGPGYWQPKEKTNE